jgi:hypothetical protein
MLLGGLARIDLVSDSPCLFTAVVAPVCFVCAAKAISCMVFAFLTPLACLCLCCAVLCECRM